MTIPRPLLGVIMGAPLALSVDLFVYAAEPGTAAIWGLAAGGALKGAIIDWLVPRGIERLAPALLAGAFVGGFFWTVAPGSGSYPADALEWWNLGPGVLLGVILIIRSRPHARRVAALEKQRWSSPS